MQIISDKVNIETQGEFASQEFTIGDPSLFLEYMRKTIYSNPKKAICQELMSNARDAHRETNKDDVPIRVKLPNKIDKSWSVRDWGPGIDPTRMRDVFTKFGNSTKRGKGAHATDDGNKQTGGFGIGAKTPWAYTDIFIICTTAKEGDKLVKRTYAAAIGDDRKCKLEEFVGAMVVIDPEDASLPEEDRCTGTTISVDIKPEDHQDFKNYSVDVCQFWDVKPEFTGTDGEVQYKEWEWKYEGKGWKIGACKNRDYGSGRNYVIVDGICYVLNTNALNGTNDKHYNVLRAGLVLWVGVSDVSVALSREALQYDERTQARLKELIEAAHDEVKARLEAEVSSASTLWEAKCMWHKMSEAFGGSFITSASWKDSAGNPHDITKHNINVPRNEIGIRLHRKDDSGGVVRYKSREETSFVCEERAMLVIDDEGFASTSRMRLETLFDQHPDVSHIYVMKVLNQQYLKDKDIVKLYAPRFISTVPKKVRIKTATATGGVAYVSRTVKAYRMLKGNGRFYDCNVDLADDTIAPVFVEVVRANPQNVNIHQIETLMELTGLAEVIGVPTRFLDQVADTWIPIATYMQDEWAKVKKGLNIKDICRAQHHQAFTAGYYHYLSSLVQDAEWVKLLHKDSLVLKWIEESKKFKAIVNAVNKHPGMKFAGLMNESSMFTNVDISDCPLKAVHDKVIERYTLLPAIESSKIMKYQYHNNGVPEISWEYVADYFNMVDASHKAASKKAMQAAACDAETI